MSMIPMRPLGFGEIVDGALQIYRRDFGLYYLIALVATFPGYVLILASGVDASAVAQSADVNPFEAFGAMGAFFGVMLASSAIAWVGMVAVAAAMADRIGEGPASLGRAYRVALRSLPSAVGATVLALIMYLFVTIVVMFGAFALLALLLSSTGIVGNLVGFLLTMLLVGLITAFWLAATFGILPAVIIEGRGAIDALGRSFSLCGGGWLRVCGIMVVAMIINVVPSIGVSALFGMGDLFVSPDAMDQISSTEQWLMNTIDLVVGPLTTPFLVGCIIVLFHDRRVRSEAFDLETLAGAMDTR